MATNIYEIVLTDMAKEELEDIYEYIYKNLYADKAANRLMDKIEKQIMLLETNPYSFVEVYIKPHNELYRKLVVDNYIILYQVEEKYKQVIIYRALYGKRDYIKIEN